MKQYFLVGLALIGLMGCAVYNSDTASVYGIGSDQWHEMVRSR